MSLRAGACLLVVVAGIFVSLLRMQVHSGLSFFLPDADAGRAEARILSALSRSAFANQVLVSVSAPDEASAVAAGRAMAEALSPLPVITGAGGEAYGALLFEHREAFISERPEAEVPALLSQAGVERSIQALKDGLAGSMGPLVRATAARDPLGFFAPQVARLAAMQENRRLRQVDGVMLTPAEAGDTVHALLFIVNRDGVIGGRRPAALLARIDDAFARVNRAQGGRLRLEVSALARYALAAERSTRADVQRISLVSGVGIAALVVVLLGSPRYLLLGILPLLSAFVTGTAACLLAYGRIHALTFAFGAALVGVCIDYPLHLFHHARGPTPRASSGVARALGLGALTTVVGLSAMGFAGLPGIREAALFGSVGVTVALLVTLWWLPPMLPRSGLPPRHARAAAWAHRLCQPSGAFVVLGPAVVLATLACIAFGLMRLRFEDDPRALTTVDPAVAAEDARVRARAFGAEAVDGGGELVVVSGSGDLESALARNDQLALALGRAKAAGAIGGFDSLHGLMWSQALQRRNLAAVQRALDLPRVRAALLSQGFVAAGFEPFFARYADLGSLSSLPFEAVPERLRALLLEPWLLELGGAPAVATRLVDVRDRARLQRALQALPGAMLVSPKLLRTRAYRDFRSRTLELAGLGLIGVFGVMAFRYRRPLAIARAFAPAALAAAGAAGLLSCGGVPLNLMHVIGLLLVLSMGADYGVFLVEPMRMTDGEGDAVAHEGATYLALAMACASTVLSFGLLSLSDVPALASVGQAVATGVVLALVLALSLQALLRRREDQGGG